MTDCAKADEREAIAIIGMSGRFPGARDIQEFWRNLVLGVESIRPFSPEEIKEAGVDPGVLEEPDYVNAAGYLDEADGFDAAFFGCSARESRLMDPQHRILLETAWAALEDAGYDPGRCGERCGVFGGVARNTYFLQNAEVYRELAAAGAMHEMMLGAEKDFPATRVSFKLNLKGPSFSIQSACSTSGVAIHLACQHLLNGECELALAGGARVQVPLTAGYRYLQGGILSPDGHCRAFDEKARGCVIGSGAAWVVLKRLADSLRDGDHIRAIILGSAVNNDGSAKVGFTAPSVEGQAAVVDEALALAAVDAETIGYIEAHGTGTSIGDPIEIAALTKAFRKRTGRTGYCAIGSVKANIGHLDAAAGVAGLIKTVLALEHGQRPPSINFERPNPEIDFAHSPFFVNPRLLPWKQDGVPRRAGVSSFGLGGTNFHAVLEEAPARAPSGPSRPLHFLAISAKTAAALEQRTRRLAAHLKQNPGLNPADASFTLHLGRKAFPHRLGAVVRDCADAIAALEQRDPKRIFAQSQPHPNPSVAFMFPGQAAQRVSMGSGLYLAEKRFRETVNFCSTFLASRLGLDLRRLLFPEPSNTPSARTQLKQTSCAQPALFTLEYALAQLWLDWGVRPEAMIGHSIGEYVAACLAGVFTLEEALGLVAARGRLMQGLPRGSMLAVRLGEEAIAPLLGQDLSLAAANGPSLCVIAGPAEAIEVLQQQLTGQGIGSRLLETSHAFHSRMMDPAVAPFRELFKGIKLRAPAMPYLSNLTGAWVTAGEATDPEYWANHLRSTVRFGAGISELLQKPGRMLLEVGPGRMLTTIARQNPAKAPGHAVLSSFGNGSEETAELESMMQALGRLWVAGVDVDWTAFYAGQQRQRLPLPTYPFEHERFWIEARGPAVKRVPAGSGPEAEVEGRPGVADRSCETGASAPGAAGHEARGLARGYAAPQNDLESQVAAIWQELFGVPRIGIHDAFIDLGGDSLLATQVVSRVRKRFQVELEVRTVLESSTVAGFSELLAQALRRRPTEEERILEALRAVTGNSE